MLRKLRSWIGGSDAPRDFTAAQVEASEVEPLIRMERIARVFVNDEVETPALRDVNLEIRRGEFVGVKGPSGSGKSTLLSIMGLMDLPTSGTYLLKGVDVSRLKAAQRAMVRNREVGFIFQYFNLIGDLNVWENVELPLTYHGMSRPERQERVEQALERVEMMDHRKRMPSQLSGGQQQRVAVARAIVGRPVILMADEPTGNLNSRQARQVIDLLVELHDSGSTIALVSHDPRWRNVVARTLEIFDGIVRDGDTGGDTTAGADIGADRRPDDTADASGDPAAS